MRRILFLFLGVIFLSAFAVTADEEYQPLQPVKRVELNGEARCLPFFVKTTFGGVAAPQIIFAYRTPDGGTQQDTVPMARAHVEIVEGQVSAYKKTSVSGQDGAIFRLSQAEYGKNQDCLPKLQQAQ